MSDSKVSAIKFYGPLIPGKEKEFSVVEFNIDDEDYDTYDMYHDILNWLND